jgi:DNA-binding NarL/FixJ family response regulator
MMTGTSDNASTQNLHSGVYSGMGPVIGAQNVVVQGGGSAVQVSPVPRSPQAARQRQAVEVWRMLRDHTPAASPTPLDVLIAKVTAGSEVLDSDTISRRLQQAADAGQEPAPWNEIVNQPPMRQTLAGVLRALSLLEHTDLGTSGARRLRDQPDADLVAEILDTVQALQRPRSPLDLQHALILATDITEFSRSGRTDHDRVALRDAMYQSLQQAVDDSIGAGWAGARTEDRGDGLLLVFPQPPQSAELLQFIDQLSTQLRQYNRVRTDKAALRLRLAIHTGRIRADEHGVLGQAINLTYRLLEARAAKAAMADTGTDLTVMLSDPLYADGLSHLGPDWFRPVSVQVKETKARGWLLVSGGTQRPQASAARLVTGDTQTTSAASEHPTAIAPSAPDLALSTHTSVSTLVRRRADDARLSEADIRLLAQIASGVTADVAARKLELSARTLRRRLRHICRELEVNTPIEAVVWAARRQLI